MKNQLKLYAVKYCEMETLETNDSITTHSRENAERFAKSLREKNHVLYSQVITYVYNTHREFYEFTTLKNYYKH